MARVVCVVQEVCDGDLTQVLGRLLLHNGHVKMPHFHGILQLARDIAAGLQHVHAHDIIHGDINPRNILIKLSRGALPLCCHAKLADFGLAMRLPSGASFIRDIKHGTVSEGLLPRICVRYALGPNLVALKPQPRP